MQVAKVLVSLYESGNLAEEHKTTILSQRGAIAGMHADRLGQHTDESTPSDLGHADLTYHHDSHLIFEVREGVAVEEPDARKVETGRD